jgi:serine O-acetyltransferase
LIKTKENYTFYLNADRIALGINKKRPGLFHDEIWKFQILLRKVEFLENCKKDPISRIICLRSKFDLENLSIKLGYSIPRNTFGPGLSIAHRGTIVVHHGVRVGENCRIHQNVTIGSDLINDQMPLLGNNSVIGPGVVIVGPITLADGIAIGANSYVNKSFLEPNITIAGCPARKVSGKSSEKRWLRATEILRNANFES